MLLVILGFVIYPEWTVSWTRRMDYRYYYDSDLPGNSTTSPSPDVWQTGFDLEQKNEVIRHLIFPRPRPRKEPLPASKSEFTGTGSVNLGQRHTTYTGATVLNLSTTINRRNMAMEVLIMLIPMGMFLVMFRDRPRKFRPPVVNNQNRSG